MATGTRELSGEKAARIVDAMRESVAQRGVAGSTFDHVAGAAGVSRGLLHYYFGTKERLLVEVVRRDCDIRLGALDAALAGARTADDVIDALVRSLGEAVSERPEFFLLVYELFTLSRRNDELAAELNELLRRVRVQLGGLLQAKADEGVLTLRADADAIADVLFALADGLALRLIAAPDRDHGDTIRAGAACARALLA